MGTGKKNALVSVSFHISDCTQKQAQEFLEKHLLPFARISHIALAKSEVAFPVPDAQIQQKEVIGSGETADVVKQQV